MSFVRVLICNILIFCGVLLLLTFPVYFYGKYVLESFFRFEKKHSNYMQVDDLAMWEHKGNVRFIQRWDEHPDGEIKFFTNSLGFRNNDELNRFNDKGLRILVTGDSHTDGVVNNEESFPNVLENLLNKRDSHQVFEVLNGGVGFYSFRNYYGFLEKHKSLQPDYYLVNVFTGNDFRENLLYEDSSNSYLNILKNVYMRVSRKIFLETKSKIPMNQGIDQTYYFNLGSYEV